MEASEKDISENGVVMNIFAVAVVPLSKAVALVSDTSLAPMSSAVPLLSRLSKGYLQRLAELASVMDTLVSRRCRTF